MDRKISETVEREPYIPGERDAHGNEIETWGPAETVGIYAFDPGSLSEPREPGADRVIAEPTIYSPFSVTFGAHDLVTRKGITYKVEGGSRQWEHPTTGEEIGSVTTLRNAEG